MSCDCAAKLAEAERRAERYREAIAGYLDWGAMTGSDRDLWESRFRAALLPPPEPAHVCLGCGTEGEPHPILHGCDRYGEPKPPEPAAEGGSNG